MLKESQMDQSNLNTVAKETEAAAESWHKPEVTDLDIKDTYGTPSQQ